MTPQERLVVLIDLITIKVIEFQNFGDPGADRYDFLEVCCRDWDQSGIDASKLSPPRLLYLIIQKEKDDYNFIQKFQTPQNYE
jgi:hypothetical protein